jgi:hypothetical protein
MERPNLRAIRCRSGSAASIELSATVEILVGDGSSASGVIECEQPGAPCRQGDRAKHGKHAAEQRCQHTYPRWPSHAEL